MQNLRDKTVKGVSWSFISQISQAVITFIIGLILARLLSPTEYGLVGMVTVFIYVSYIFIDSGFSSALIQRKNCTNTDYSTVFYFNLFISTLIFITFFLSAEIISGFYNEPRLVNIVRVLSVLVILFAFSIVQKSILTKKINFRLQTLTFISSQIVSGIVGIIMAIYGYGVWSLIWKTILNQLLINLQYWFFVKWRPSLVFSKNSLKDMFSYSSKLLASGIINRIYDQSYSLIIGKFFNSRELGLYSRADQFVRIPSESISGSIMSVSFPVFSELQNEPVRLKNAALKIIKMTMFVNFNLLIGLFVISDNLVAGVLGNKWLDSVVYLKILCISGMIYPLHPINLNLITALGRSDIFLKLEIMKKLFAVPVIILGILLGVKAMIISMVISSLMALFINSFYSKKLVNLGLKEQLLNISGSFISGVIMGIIVFIIGLILNGKVNNITALIIQVTAGITTVLFLSKIFRNSEYLELKSIMHQYLKKSKNNLP
jgi:O-antigen/teichoic acid export membrane protein